MNPSLEPYEKTETVNEHILGLDVEARLTFRFTPDVPLAQTCTTQLVFVEILSITYPFCDHANPNYDASKEEIDMLRYYFFTTATPKT